MPSPEARDPHRPRRRPLAAALPHPHPAPAPPAPPPGLRLGFPSSDPLPEEGDEVFGKEGGGRAAPLLPMNSSPSSPLRRDIRSGAPRRGGAGSLGGAPGRRIGSGYRFALQTD